ncbi:ComEC/Rec2 family competence protein [Erythrobacter mangrovi]|uniref:ComEC/Rec2 family competence protein n=1 Tax=Erythrobacter mangrovi TaxID=2739433 RepID=A0A7D4C4W3_9SPHN|nr:ComEC/Rec2 family competence protein [Erythrobacter mangrovi]QKG71645.1 ComEC/Rec2 family competence protein [Erythrobacter mangrovi]
MATQGTPLVPLGEAGGTARDAVRRPWRMRGLLSRFTDRIERLLAGSEFDRGPWLAVALAAGIALWFGLGSPWQWLAAMGAFLLLALSAAAIWRGRNERSYVMVAAIAVSLTIALGVAVVWARSEIVGAEPIPAPRFERLDARILERQEQPTEGRIRLTLAARDVVAGRAVAYRVNLPLDQDAENLREGARVRLSVRLLPPAPPIVPGAYNFARRAWFEGLSATGAVAGTVEVLEPPKQNEGRLARVQRDLSSYVRSRLDGAPGAIAATLASGDRGAIPSADEEAMRDAGLTHLLSISGLHVSAIIAATYLLTLKLLACWPWFALRVRLPLVAAGAAALAGIGYTLLTGAEVPTIRSCIGAVLVLLALALGREPLSMRMVAVAAMLVLLLWPESLIGPSFQMSFAAVLAIVALHGAKPVREFLAPREEGWTSRLGRRLAVLFLTGLVIEIALMPIVLFHFHRAGVYGALANLVAIPLVTFVSMPLLALAMAFDMVGMGAPFWWLAGHSLELLLDLAHFAAGLPGAVKLAPPVPPAALLLFVGGGLWLALWHGTQRLWGLVPAIAATVWMLSAPVPDILVTRDGRDFAIVGEGDQVLVLRQSEGGYAQDSLLEIAASGTEPQALAEWSGARCSDDFCALELDRGGRTWRLLVSRSRNLVEERALAAACEKADIVISDRYLPRACRPAWLRLDRRFLQREGGVALYLASGRIDTVARTQGEHGWWRPREDRPRRAPPSTQ